jgi:hypothetical protein
MDNPMSLRTNDEVIVTHIEKGKEEQFQGIFEELENFSDEWCLRFRIGVATTKVIALDSLADVEEPYEYKINY